MMDEEQIKASLDALAATNRTLGRDYPHFAPQNRRGLRIPRVGGSNPSGRANYINDFLSRVTCLERANCRHLKARPHCLSARPTVRSL